MKVRNRGAQLERLQVFEHQLVFGADGWADASELTEREIERLRAFHFLFSSPEPAAPTLLIEDEPECTDDLQDDVAAEPEPAAPIPAPVSKPAARRPGQRKK